MVALAGCHSTPDGVPRERLLDQLLSTVCTAASNCCNAAALEIDNQRCHDDVVTKMGLPIQDPQLEYDAVEAQSCLDSMTASIESCQVIDYSPCLAAFHGPNLPPGAPCSSSLDCAKGPWGQAVCTRSQVCVQPQRGAVGQPCAYSCTDGPNGAECLSLFTQTDPPEQIACHSWDQVTCVSAGDGSPTCQPLAAQDCRPKGDDACPGGYCDVTTGQCRPASPAGGPCTSSECGSAGYCTQGVCQPTKPVNGLCVDSVECQSKRCIQGLCAAFSKVAAEMCFDRTPQN